MKKQSGSAHLFVIVGILIVIIGALGFVFWSNSKPSGVRSGSVATQDTSRSEPITQAASSWTAYRGDALPVTFRYPSDWEIVGVAGSKSSAIRAFYGPRSSSESITLSILYRKGADTRPDDSCTADGIEHVARCEKYSTKTMSGLLRQWEDGSGFSFNSYIGGDMYAVLSYNNSVNKEDFKKILQSIDFR